MREKTLDFSEMPASFGRCMQSECPKAESCLRRMAMRREEPRGSWLTVLNPSAVASFEACSFYIDAYHPVCAKGLVYDLKEVPLGKAEAIMRQLVSKFGKMKLSRMRRGLCVISPKDQKVLADIFAQYDAPQPTFAKRVHPWVLG